MGYKLAGIIAAAAIAVAGTASASGGPTDPEIAHIAYTAGNIDVAAARQALAKSRNQAVRAFAMEMVRDHEAVNAKALALVKALNVTPEDNPTSQGLAKSAEAELKRLAALNGASFDKAYVKNEVAFHATVNGALELTLIPSAKNDQLKALLDTGLTLFREHQMHAEHLDASLR